METQSLHTHPKEVGMFRDYYKRKITDEVEINLMPFINFLVVLIPVLMLSAEFSQINILDAQTAKTGSDPTTTSDQKSTCRNLVICLSDSAINIASDDRFLASINCTSQYLPATELTSALSAIRSGIPPTMDRIIIASDRKVKYQRVIDVMDLAKKNGFGDISITRLRG
jgi:biopolymer transport protein ExbD